MSHITVDPETAHVAHVEAQRTNWNADSSEVVEVAAWLAALDFSERKAVMRLAERTAEHFYEDRL